MFDIKKAYGFDKEAAEKGVKMICGPDPDKDYVVLCRMPNDRYTAALTTKMQANHSRLEILKKQDEEAYGKLNRQLMIEVMAETVVVAWGPGFGEDGTAIKYSTEVCIDFLAKYPDFRAACAEFASNPSNYPIVSDLKEAKK